MRIAALVALAGATAASAASAATLPPALVAIEQKTAELKITSLLFSLKTSVTTPRRDRGLGKLLKLLLEEDATGEVSVTPPGGAIVTLELFGSSIRARILGSTVYITIPGLAAHDGGKPWVELDSSQLRELLPSSGKPNTHGRAILPGLAQPPFAELEETLAHAREVRQLPDATLEGQTVSRFLAVLKRTQLGHGALATSRAGRGHRTSSKATLEVSFTDTGLPLRTVISERAEGVGITTLLQIPVVNFPLVVTAPPAQETITLEAFKKLAQRERAKRKPRAHHRRK